MHLVAGEVFAEVKEDDAPYYVGFYDRAADYCLYLSRFSDVDPDEGTIEIMVQDQVWTPSATRDVRRSRARCRVVLDEATAARLTGEREYIVDFEADEGTYARMVEVLRVIFTDRPGLTIEDAPNAPLPTP